MEAYRILVVEDDQEILDGVGIYLKNQGYTVFKALNGAEGLKILEKEEIHLAIVDIMMPVMDGITATRTIRGLMREEAERIPIIAMTANAFEEDRKRSMEAGMNGHVAKPLDMQEILKTIVDCIQHK